MTHMACDYGICCSLQIDCLHTCNAEADVDDKWHIEMLVAIFQALDRVLM